MQDNKEGVPYEGGRDAAAFINFFNEKSGLERTSDGGYAESAGRVPELDELAKEFVTAAPAERASIASRAAEAVKNSVHKNAKEFGRFYTLAMKAIGEGKDYVTSEVARLQKLSLTSLTAKAKAAILKRINIVKHAFGSHQQPKEDKDL